MSPGATTAAAPQGSVSLLQQGGPESPSNSQSIVILQGPRGQPGGPASSPPKASASSLLTQPALSLSHVWGTQSPLLALKGKGLGQGSVPNLLRHPAPRPWCVCVCFLVRVWCGGLCPAGCALCPSCKAGSRPVRHLHTPPPPASASLSPSPPTPLSLRLSLPDSFALILCTLSSFCPPGPLPASLPMGDTGYFLPVIADCGPSRRAPWAL
jgi:hypothetical protein